MSEYNKPSVKDWEKHEDLLDAGTKGWNPLVRIPQLLEDHFDWAKEFKFGFFIDSEVAEAGSKGWAHVKKENFDPITFNSVVPLRFGLIDSGGVIKWRDNYLMMMPKDFRRRQMQKRFDEHERIVADTLKNKSYAAPEDPQYAKMKQHAEEISQEGTEFSVVKGPPPAGEEATEESTQPAKRKPGRPRKEK